MVWQPVPEVGCRIIHMGSDWSPLNFKGAKLCSKQFPMQKCLPNPHDVAMKPSHSAGITTIVFGAEKLRRGPHPGATGTTAPLPPAKRSPSASSPPATSPHRRPPARRDSPPIPYFYFG